MELFWGFLEGVYTVVSKLAQRRCVPCQGGVPPLGHEAITSLLKQLNPHWSAVNDHHLEREYLFFNFKEGFDFVINVGNLAESEGHHPDIYLAWGKVKLTLWTHKINGLTESDFIFAAKVDQLTGLR